MPSSIRHSVCRWCYADLPLERLATAAKQIGIDSIELLNPEDFPTIRKHGLTCAMVSFPTAELRPGMVIGGITHGWNDPAHHPLLQEIYARRIADVAAAGLNQLICFSGNRRRGGSDEEGLEHCERGLRQILPIAEKHGVTLVMELLNSKVDHPDYMCDHTAWGVELARRLSSERFRLLYDIYHMQIMEGDVIRTIRQHAKWIAHYHTAGNPGRHEFEPSDAQELNYPAIMRAIQATDYRGHVGQEFVPQRDPLSSLAKAVALCTV